MTTPRTHQVIMIVICVIVIGAGGFGLYKAMQVKPALAPVNAGVTDQANVSITNGNGDIALANQNGNENTNAPVTNANGNANTNTAAPVYVQKTSLDVSKTIQWDGPKPIASLHIFTPTTDGYNPEIGWEGSDAGSKYYSVGQFLSGKYKGGEIIIATAFEEGPVIYPTFYYVVRVNGKLTLLAKVSNLTITALGTDVGIDASKVQLDTTTTIASLIFPSTVTSPSTKVTFVKPDYINYGFFDATQLVKVFTDGKLGDAYVTTFDATAPAASHDLLTANGLYFRAPDGTLRYYDMHIGFMNTAGVPTVTWTNSTKNTQEYLTVKHTGCGSTNFIDVITPAQATIAKDMVAAGQTSTGDTVYTLKDSNHAMLKDLYDNGYWVQDGNPKMSYADFIAKRPYIFWVDPFGRVVRMMNSTFQTLAECGKPVIYLYPTKTTDVSVTLKPAGGFTYTEPTYGTGWHVRATPSGQLTDLTTGKAYPYLFWEGRGGLFFPTTKGFLVTQANVHSFLAEKLAALGLNAKESADFVAFWEPRMQGSPYYVVNFYGKATMDKIAPLSVTPKPDTVIRILMDYQGLTQPVNVQGYPLHAPARNGFTVVEWGGVLH